MTEMTSKERMLAAMRREPVDRVPVVMDFWTAGPEEQQFSWASPEERIAWDREWGFDPCLYLPPPWEGDGAAEINPAIQQRVWEETDPLEPYLILCSEWTSTASRRRSPRSPAKTYGRLPASLVRGSRYGRA